MNQKAWTIKLDRISPEDERSARVKVFAVTTAQLDVIESDPWLLRNLLPKDAAVMDCGEFGVLFREGDHDWLLPIVSETYPKAKKDKKPVKLAVKVPKQIT